MERTADQNANRLQRASANRRFHESRLIEPTHNGREAVNRIMNGSAKSPVNAMKNGKLKKQSTNSLDPNNFAEAAMLLGSVGSLRAAQTTDKVMHGSTSHEEDIYRGFNFPFENLVFEGGGNKGMAYVGALQVF